MKRQFSLLAPLLLLGCAASHAAPVPTPPTLSPASSTASSTDKIFDGGAASAFAEQAAPLVAAQNDFGARLASRLEAQNTKNENLLISPTSLWQALALASGGARGDTKTQMGALLAMQNLPDDKIAAANRAFNSLLAEQKGASISVANSVWLADDFKANPDFIQGASANFGAGVELFPQADPAQGASRINDWVSQHTQKEISRIVSTRDVAGASALLVNAVYFRGSWQSAFAKDATKAAPFHLADGTTIEVPTMNGEKQRAYLSGDSFEGVRLPYVNTSCALWVLLPTEGKKLGDVLNELGSDATSKLRGSGPVVVSLPRFEIEWTGELVTNLSAMNAPLPFSYGADFSAMGAPAKGISNVLHVCKMKVDEEGTVAAAATATTMRRAAAIHRDPKVIQFDRPFVVALVEETSGACLFDGIINHPGVAN